MKRVNPSYVKLDKIEPDLSQLHLTESKLKNHRLRRRLFIQQARSHERALRQQSKVSSRRDWMIFFVSLLLMYFFWKWLSMDSIVLQEFKTHSLVQLFE